MNQCRKRRSSPTNALVINAFTRTDVATCFAFLDVAFLNENVTALRNLLPGLLGTREPVSSKAPLGPADYVHKSNPLLGTREGSTSNAWAQMMRSLAESLVCILR